MLCSGFATAAGQPAAEVILILSLVLHSKQFVLHVPLAVNLTQNSTRRKLLREETNVIRRKLHHSRLKPVRRQCRIQSRDQHVVLIMTNQTPVEVMVALQIFQLCHRRLADVATQNFCLLGCVITTVHAVVEYERERYQETAVQRCEFMNRGVGQLERKRIGENKYGGTPSWFGCRDQGKEAVGIPWVRMDDLRVERRKSTTDTCIKSLQLIRITLTKDPSCKGQRV